MGGRVDDSREEEANMNIWNHIYAMILYSSNCFLMIAIYRIAVYRIAIYIGLYIYRIVYIYIYKIAIHRIAIYKIAIYRITLVHFTWWFICSILCHAPSPFFWIIPQILAWFSQDRVEIYTVHSSNWRSGNYARILGMIQNSFVPIANWFEVVLPPSVRQSKSCTHKIK